MMTRRITTALAAVALVGALGACGGDDDTDTEDPVAGEGTGGGGQGDSEEAAEATLDYAQCMRDHGLDFPDPEIGEDGGPSINLPDPETAGVTEEEMRTAVEECQQILDDAQGTVEPLDPDALAERQDQALAMAQCMRDRGWDMPDPEVEEGGGIAIQNPPEVGGPGDPNFEKFQEDLGDCEDEAGMERPEGEEQHVEESGEGEA